MHEPISDNGCRHVVAIVALLNIAYFGIVFAVALAIGSVSLFADSIDLLEDAAENFLIFTALGWSAARRAKVGMALAGILLVPGIAMLSMALNKFMMPAPPEAVSLSVTGAGVLAVNLACALMLARFHTQGSSLTRAALCPHAMTPSRTSPSSQRALSQHFCGPLPGRTCSSGSA